MKLPVRILSDLHLGHKASRIGDVDWLRGLLRGAGTVVFNGDTWEELARPWRERSGEMLDRMKEVVAEEGCEMIFLRGNHDPGMDGVAWLELADGRVVVTHGDGLLRNSSPWKRELLGMDEKIEKIWRRHPEADVDVEERLAVAREIALEYATFEHPKGRRLFERVMDAAFPPRRALAILWAWVRQGELGAEFCEKYFPKAEFLVVGHLHRAAVNESRGRVIVNTGSFVIPGRARWVEWDGEFLSTGFVEERRGGFSKGGSDESWRIQGFS
ncbi:MAG: metallophosphoesterase [Luteolibacter sp.]